MYLPDVDLGDGKVAAQCMERVYGWVWVGVWVFSWVVYLPDINLGEGGVAVFGCAVGWALFLPDVVLSEGGVADPCLGVR